jgi:hypothetical protein
MISPNQAKIEPKINRCDESEQANSDQKVIERPASKTMKSGRGNEKSK